MPTLDFTVNASALTVRSAPDKTAKKIGSFKKGKKVKIAQECGEKDQPKKPKGFGDPVCATNIAWTKYAAPVGKNAPSPYYNSFDKIVWGRVAGTLSWVAIAEVTSAGTAYFMMPKGVTPKDAPKPPAKKPPAKKTPPLVTAPVATGMGLGLILAIGVGVYLFTQRKK